MFSQQVIVFLITLFSCLAFFVLNANFHMLVDYEYQLNRTDYLIVLLMIIGALCALNKKERV